MKVLKVRADRVGVTWSSEEVPAHGKGVGLTIFKGPFWLKTFYDSMNKLSLLKC